MANVNELSLVFGSDEHKSEHSDGECPGGSLDWVALYPRLGNVYLLSFL